MQPDAIFLDRDGVINRYPGDYKYVTSTKKFHFLPHARKAIALLHQKGIPLFVISNQAGVGKGVYSQRTLDAITHKMLAGIRASGGEITQVYYCTHRPEAGCACRKPKTGSLRRAKKAFKISLKRSFFIGDSMIDIQTARNAGARAILLLSGREKLSNSSSWEEEPDYIFKHLLDAARFIASCIRKRS